MAEEDFIDSVERQAKHLLAIIVRPIALRDTFPFEVMLWIGTLWFLKSFFIGTDQMSEYVAYWKLERAGWRPSMYALVLFLSIFPIWGVLLKSGIIRRIWLAGELLWWAYLGVFYQLSRPENPNSITPLLFAAIAVICSIEQAKREIVIGKVRRLIEEEDGGKK